MTAGGGRRSVSIPGRYAAVAVQEQSVREAACRAVEDLAEKVRYQIAPVE